jgi:hypothetical protein
LREGLRYNPGNPQLLYELGRIDFDEYHDPARARSVWEAALVSWAQEQPGVPLADRLKYGTQNFDDRFIYEQLQERLARLEEQATNYNAAIARLQMAQVASPKPADLQLQIDDLKRKLKKP